MKKLDYKKSELILKRLFEKFGRRYSVEKYLKRNLFRLGIFTWVRNMPNLWYPQKNGQKFIKEIFEDYIAFEQVDDCLLEVLLPKIASYFQSIKENKILGVGDWVLGDKNGGKIIEFQETELANITKNLFSEAYFFNENIDWIFTLTHENFCFLAGNKKFIDSFKNFFPDYKKYELKYNMLDPE